MKVLYVITGLGLGGAENVVANLADEMLALGHQVKIAYLIGEVKVKPKSSNIDIIYLGLEGFSSLFSASKTYQQLVKEYQPDVIHAHMVHANIFTRLNRLFCAVPRLINSAHSNIEGGQLRMLAYRITHSLADKTTNVSQNAVKEFEKRKAAPIDGMKVVYNGIDLNKFNVKNVKKQFFMSSEINFISVGRLHESKDYPNLIWAVYQVKQQTNKPIKFYIAGEGELRPQLEGLIQQLNLTNDIILFGARSRSDIPDLLNAADFFVLPSKYEGLPTVVIEAMACECFTIATDCGGSTEILGETGILVEPQNPEKLAQAILNALRLSKEEIQENNQLARKRVEELFSLEQSVKIWLDIYENK